MSRKIAVLANNSGGLYVFRGMLLLELVKQGNQVTVFTPFDDKIEELKEIGVMLYETPIDRRGTNPLKDFSLLMFYKRELKRIEPDLVITYTIKPNIYGGLVCRQLKIPHAANITGIGHAFEDSGYLRRIVTILNRTALKETKTVFFENTENRDYFIRERIVTKDKAYVLHGAGVDLGFFCYQDYPKNTVFKFLFIGRIMREKGIEELIEALEKLKDEGTICSLDVLGNYEEDYKDRLMEAEQQSILSYHGYQSDVRPFIRNCDCFVLPSYHEGMANTNLECAASGRPIITSNIPGCKEAVLEGKSGFLCEPKNMISLYESMKKMIMLSRDQREEMGRLGRKHMEDVFDKRKVVAETIMHLQ